MAANENEIVITRDFDAPRDLLYKVWTEPHHVEKWWGPRGYSVRVNGVDLRAGGKWEYIMVGPDGAEFPINGVFLEIVEGERIVTSDEFGEGMDEILKGVVLPKGIVITALFDDLGIRSRLTLRISHPTLEDRRKHEDMGVVAGWNSSFDCMDEYLAELQK